MARMKQAQHTLVADCQTRFDHTDTPPATAKLPFPGPNSPKGEATIKNELHLSSSPSAPTLFPHPKMVGYSFRQARSASRAYLQQPPKYLSWVFYPKDGTTANNDRHLSLSLAAPTHKPPKDNRVKFS
jgi:hypothetical protein